MVATPALTLRKIPYLFLLERFGEEMLIKVVNAFEMAHDKGAGRMYLVPQTDLENVVNDRVVMTERDATV